MDELKEWKDAFYCILLFSYPVWSNSLQFYGLQHTRPLCLSPFPKVCPSSCPLHWWWHQAISSSDALFSFCPQSFPASGSFPMSWLFTSDGQSIGASASALNIQGWFPLGFTGLISFQLKWTSKVFSNTTIRQHQFFGAQPSLWSNS